MDYGDMGRRSEKFIWRLEFFIFFLDWRQNAPDRTLFREVGIGMVERGQAKLTHQWDSFVMKEFKELLFYTYFLDTVKKKLEKDFWKLWQGIRSIWEYESEFSYIINYIPYVV